MSTVFNERTFDRLEYTDPRSLRGFPITALFSANLKPRSYTWTLKLWLDQGREGACTGFATSHELAAKPKVVPGVDNQTAQALYKMAQTLDEWPGESYSGSSVTGAMKAAQTAGFYNAYRWAAGVEDLAVAVSRKGPAILGVDWFASMFNAGEDGFLRITQGARPVGGHAILCVGFSVKRQAFRLHNSWGKDFGDNGRAWISCEDMNTLFQSGGEAAIPVVR